MPLIDRPPRARKSRANDHAIGLKRVRKGVCDGANIAVGGRIKRGAVFEEKLCAALSFQPGERGQRLRDGSIGRDGAGFERDHACLNIQSGVACRHAGILHRAHALFGQRVGQIA